MVTSNDVRDGVFAALKERFPSIKRYGEEIKQGLTAPCFFVKLLSASHEKEVDRRYMRSHPFDVHYFATSNEDAHGMADHLYDCLERVQFAGGSCSGRRMRQEVIDGVLHFFVDYDFHVMRERPEEPKMQDLQVEGRLVDG